MPASSFVSAGGLATGSSSSIIAGDVSGYHVLKIVGYSRTKEVPNGKQIESCPFRVGGRTWSLRYYPNGSMSDNPDSISLFLYLDDTVTDTEPVKAEFRFSLLEQDGKQVPSYSYTKNGGTHDFAVGKSRGRGYPNFIKREELEKSKHLKDDSFTVKVDITLSEFYKQETPSIVVPPSDMHRHFGDLLSSKEGVDVEFRVGGEAFWAHRYVLAARSPVFRAELFGSMKESTTKNAIHVHDMEAEVFSNLLTFIYTDHVPPAPGTSQLDEYAMAQHLLVAADRYGLERLILICENKLCNHIDASSVATILALAEQHHRHGLKNACLVFLGSLTNLNAVRESEGFDYLTKTFPAIMKDLLISKVIAG